MDLNIKITLSDRLFALLKDKLPNLGRRIDRSIGKELGAQARKEFNTAISLSSGDPESDPEESTKQQRSLRKKTDASEVVQEVAEPQPAIEESVPSAENTIPTIEDCRAALHRARIRFEGEDYENKASEGREKFHKAVTSQVKQILLTVSGGRADKIPDLPEDRRAAFIAECDALILDDNGFITPPPAPY